MFAVRNGLMNMSRLSSVRQYNTIVCTPPTVKVSTAEKLISLGCIAVSFLMWPMYFAPNFKHWAKAKKQ